MPGSDHADEGFAEIDAAALLADLSASEASEQPLARAALPTLLEASGLSKRRAKAWSEELDEGAPAAAHMTGRATGVWTAPGAYVNVTTAVFTSVPLALEYLENETSDAAVEERRARSHDRWVAELGDAAAAAADAPAYEVETTVTPIAALTASGERVCRETVVRVTAPATGSERRQYERVAHLRVGRLVVEIVTREPDSVGTVMAGVLGRYETRLREQAGTYR